MIKLLLFFKWVFKNDFTEEFFSMNRIKKKYTHFWNFFEIFFFLFSLSLFFYIKVQPLPQTTFTFIHLNTFRSLIYHCSLASPQARMKRTKRI